MTGFRGARVVAELALADLRHEWILSLCLFLSVAAVVGPLLLLFGLKNGTMETLRDRLLEDPRNREIRPMVSRSFSPDWLAALGADPRTAFLVPTTRSISASVTLKSPSGKLGLDALPSAQGDPLLLENGAKVPGEKECVLSAEAARKLNLKTGEMVVLEVARLKGKGFETGTAAIRVAGVLNPRATAREAVYFPLTFLEDIEGFKDGQAVTRLGWKGTTPVAQPVFDGVVLGLDAPVDPVLKVRLTSGTGLSRLEPLEADQLLPRLGYPLLSRSHWYLLTTRNAQGKDLVSTVAARLRGRNPLVLPWVSPLSVRLSKDLTLPLLALPPDQGMEDPWSGKRGNAALRQVILPQGADSGQDLMLTLAQKDLPAIRVTTVQGLFSPGPWALAPPDLAGILNLNQRRDIDWDEKEDIFILKRRGYAAFRLYARTLDDVEPLKRSLEAQSIPVHTEAARIRDLRELDRHLGTIFWFIALGGLLGGAGSLSASLYASVERKRRDLGVLGLIGFTRGGLLCFPLFQALFLTLGGLALALGFYAGMAGLINQLFASQLAEGERFCRLGGDHLAWSAAGVVMLGQLAAALAAFRVITIDPAEALRDE